MIELLTPRASERFWSKVAIGAPDDCWPWQAYLRFNGYGEMRLGSKAVKAHRIAWALANGSDPGELLVIHSCDNRACVNPVHLRTGTYQDNHNDMDSRGRRPSLAGSRNPRAILNERDALIIRILLHIGCTQKEVAARYGLSSNSVCNIATGKLWPHVPSAEEWLAAQADNHGREVMTDATTATMPTLPTAVMAA